MAYRISKRVENWKDFKRMVKKANISFFDNKIQVIISRNYKPWDLMNWVKKQKLLAIKAI